MMLICGFSIMLGACALTLVSAIMNGFDHETRTLIQGISSDIIITAGHKSIRYDALRRFLEQNFPHDITGISPNTREHALIQVHHQAGAELETSPILIVAIDPTTEPHISRLHTMITQAVPHDSFAQLFDNDGCLIGESLAHALALSPGQTVTLVYNPEHSGDAVMEKYSVPIRGFIKTGIDELDTHILVCSLSLVTHLFSSRGITQVGIKLRSPHKQKAVLERLHRELPEMTSYAWQDLYPALLSALTLEKYAMFLILLLITLVASMNIVALLFMYITSKKEEIALLQTMGASARSITAIFTMIGVTIASTGAVIGIIIAVISSYALNTYKLIPLPDVYYVTHVPALLETTTLCTVFLLVVFISFIASYIPARRIQRLSVASILKHTT